MKFGITTAVALVMGAGAALAQPTLNEQAPDFTATTIEGETITLSDLHGQKVVLEWTNHGCPFVQKHYDSGNMQSTQEFADEQGALWISVISSAPGKQGHVTAAKARELTVSRGASPDHIVLDETGDIGKLYTARTTPHMFVINEGGALSYAGAIDSIPSGNPADIEEAENYVQSALTDLAAGEEVRTPTSSPYGCSVKYGS